MHRVSPGGILSSAGNGMHEASHALSAGDGEGLVQRKEPGWGARKTCIRILAPGGLEQAA